MNTLSEKPRNRPLMSTALSATQRVVKRYTGSVRHVVLLLLAVAGAHRHAAAQTHDTLRVTLDECLSSATMENPEVLLAKMEIARANYQLQSVRGGFYPQIAIDGQYTRNIKRPVFFLPPGESFGGGPPSTEGTIIEAGFDNSYNIGAQATIPLYNRELIASSKAAKAAVTVQEKGLDISKNDIRARVRKAYFEALLASESLLVLRQSLRNAQSNFENIQNQFRQQLVAEYDVIRADVQVENLRPEILQAENNYEAALNNLKLLVNIPQETPMALEESLIDLYGVASAETVTDEYDVTNNPELQQLDLQEYFLTEQISVQQATFFPSVAAFGNYAWQSQANNFNFGNYFWVNTAAVGLQLSIPVFQGFTRVRQVQQARIDIEQARIQRGYQQRTLGIQAQNAYNRITRAQKSFVAQERNIAQAEKGYSIARISYNSGVGTLIEVNDAELALTQARLNQLEVIYEYLNALADFNQLTGNDTTK